MPVLSWIMHVYDTATYYVGDSNLGMSQGHHKQFEVGEAEGRASFPASYREGSGDPQPLPRKKIRNFYPKMACCGAL